MAGSSTDQYHGNYDDEALMRTVVEEDRWFAKEEAVFLAEQARAKAKEAARSTRCVPDDCVLVYRASNNTIDEEICDSQLMWTEDAFKLSCMSSLDFSRASFVWAAILHVERNAHIGDDRCVSFSKRPDIALSRAKSENTKYIHVAMLKKRRVVDLSSCRQWMTTVKAWIGITGDKTYETVMVGNRNCSKAYWWSNHLEEVVCDRVNLEQDAEWIETINFNELIDQRDLEAVSKNTILEL